MGVESPQKKRKRNRAAANTAKSLHPAERRSMAESAREALPLQPGAEESPPEAKANERPPLFANSFSL